MRKRDWFDLRFVIGSFLSVIGALVLLQYARNPEIVSEGTHVNLLGGSLLLGAGVALGLSGWFGKEPT
jgi:hypothetical protein